MKEEEKAMRRSIGLLEYKSIAKGMEACDEMLKSSNVELVLASPVCPGKYIVILSGDVGAVENAVKVGKSIGDSYLISDYLIANVNENVFPVITGTIDMGKIDSLGFIETGEIISTVTIPSPSKELISSLL